MELELTGNAMAAPPPTRSVEQGMRNLDALGFTIHENFVEPDELARLRDRLEEQAELEREQGVAAFAFDHSDNEIPDNFTSPFIGKPVGLPRVQRVHLLVNKGRIFIDLAKNAAGVAYARHIFKQIPFNIIAQFGLILRRGAPAQPLHIDEANNIPFAMPIPVSINIMVALGAYDVDMGATRVVPGSHLWRKDRIAEYRDRVETVPLVLQPGSAAIWESRLWHCQGEVVSEQPRCSVGIAYGIDFLKPLDCFAAAIHDDVYRTMSDEEKALYGLELSSGGRIGPRSPDDSRSNMNFQMPYVPELRAGQNRHGVFVGGMRCAPQRKLNTYNQ